MPSLGPEARALAERYRLDLAPAGVHGAAGELLGRGTGSSLEFQDRRAYAPGDDVRLVDWRAYARTDQVLVRQYREEVRPRVDVVVDTSRSMAVDDAKARVAVDLAYLLASVARADTADARLVAAGDAPELVDLARLEAGAPVELASRARLDDALHAAGALLRPGSLRILVSDLLCPAPASSIVHALARGAGRAAAFAVVQVLGPTDEDPPLGPWRLVDAEDERASDQVLDASAVAGYRERLERLTEAARTECRRAGGRLARLGAGAGLAALCRGPLVREGVLAPR